MSEPVLVIHGVANHIESDFRDRVSGIQRYADKHAAGQYRFIPLFWGDLGAKVDYVLDALPARGDAVTRSLMRGADPMYLVIKGFNDRVEATPSLVRGGGDDIDEDQLREAIEAVWPELTEGDEPLSEDELEKVGRAISEAMGQMDEAGEMLVRGVITDAGDYIKGVVAGVKSAVHRRIGRTLGGLLNDIRHKLMPQVGEFLGDVFVYQRHRERIQKRVRDVLAKCAPGYGTTDNPIRVIGHSLGGVIAFDAAAGWDPPVYINRLITMGSQPALLHAIDPRDEQELPLFARLQPYTGQAVDVPNTIERWINLWEPLDPFAFVTQAIFNLPGDGPTDIEIDHDGSGLYTHSAYWQHAQALDEMLKALK